MVKVGIIGADLPISGELIRLLAFHPETDIISLYAPEKQGRNVASIHHGLIGENTFYFSDKINLSDLDVLFIFEKSEISEIIIKNQGDTENLKIVALWDVMPEELILTGKSEVNPNSEVECGQQAGVFEEGLSEINRKALVRGANKAYLLPALIVPSLITLVPLAHYLLLNSEIEIEITAPEDILRITDITRTEELLCSLLKKRQSSFNGAINLQIKELKEGDRNIITKISLKNGMILEDIEKIYDQIYDDHNFSFLSRNKINEKEVTGTQKTIFYLDKPDKDKLDITVFADTRMRGGAGDAVHVMNLFFGLHEKTGLELKASSY